MLLDCIRHYFEEAFSSWGNLLECSCAFIAIVTLPLGIKRHKYFFPLSFFLVFPNGLVYFIKGSYLLSVRKAIEGIFNLYGWRQWRMNPEKKQHQSITRLCLRTTLLALGVALLAYLFILSLVLGFKEHEWIKVKFGQDKLFLHPYIESLVFVLTLLGMWISAHKKLESYLFWLHFNILSIYYHAVADYNYYALKYMFFLGASLVGFIVWGRDYMKMKKQKSKKS